MVTQVQDRASLGGWDVEDCPKAVSLGGDGRAQFSIFHSIYNISVPPEIVFGTWTSLGEEPPGTAANLLSSWLSLFRSIASWE